MKPEHEIHVISNTHWDREWRFPFERTRAMLVEMMDRLLELLDTCEGFRFIHLDAQTVMLEDYLEVRPERREQLERHVRDGRLLVGPWYTLPDACSCSGEALVRNLLRGHRQAAEFGRVMKVGYTPNGFGQPSQLPQLYAGFGIDSVMFYRGAPRHEVKSEFIWEGADGTRAFAFRFGKYARYNFFFLVYRPTVHGRKAFECEYRWDERSLPFRLDRDLSYEPYYLLDFKPRFDADKILPGIEEMIEVDAAASTTPIVLAMQGYDSTAPDDTEARIVAEINRRLGETKTFHSSLEEVVRKVKAAAPADLQVARGEMRHTLHSGGQTDLYPAIYGCRVYLRQANAFSEANLENRAEPAAAMAWLAGEEYPARLLDRAWRLLLHNHAHDSIGGCAMDRVHDDCMNRYARCNDIAHEVTRASLAKVVRHLDTSALPPDAILLLAVNTLPQPRSGVVAAAVDIPRAAAAGDVEILTLEVPRDAGVSCSAGGTKLPHQVVATEQLRPTVQKPNDIPSLFHATRCHVRVEIPEIPAMGWRAFIVRPTAARPKRLPNIGRRVNELVNDHLKVSVNRDGTFDIVDRKTDRSYRGLHYFESGGETGDPWNRITPKDDAIFSSRGGKARVKRLANGPMEASIEISLVMKLPEGVLPDRSRRSPRLVDYPIRTVVALRRGSRLLDIATTVHNVAKDHRLRLLLPTGLAADHSWAHMPFDVVRRPVHVPGPDGWLEPPTGSHPQKWFVDVSDGAAGLAVLNRGITQYEVIENDERPIALTLMRCFQMRNTVQNIDYPDQPGTQCQGVQEFRYALLPHAGDWDAGGVMGEAARWNVPPIVCQIGTGSGIAPALPPEAGLLEMLSDGLAFSGIKPAADGSGLIVRFYNPTERTITGELLARMPIANAQEVRLDETPLRDLPLTGANRVRLENVGTRKVVTVKLQFKGNGS